MMLPLRLGALSADGFAIRRSGVHWLCGEGHLCRPGEVVGYCNLDIGATSLRRIGAKPFADDNVLQIALAPRVGGRLRLARGASVGGYLNTLALRDWNPADEIATIEDPQTTFATGEEEVCELRHLLLAGRRMGWAVDVDTGLLPGWHARARAWSPESPSRDMPTLLAMGICDAISVVRGDRSGFLEMFEAAPFPIHVVTASEHPNAACAPVVLDQFERTPSDRAAISADIARALHSGAAAPTPEDYVFMGALLTQLRASPIRERLDVIASGELTTARPPAAILMSMSAEPRSILRHRRLGYHLNVLGHNQRAAGRVAREWLRSAFEPVSRDLLAIQRDYARLFDTVSAQIGARFIVVNRMSTSGTEDLSSYAAFDAPMGDALASVSAKEMNLMLDDLTDEHPVDVLDVDAIAADLGGARHLPDGIHQSGAMQSALRAEILGLLPRTISRRRSPPAGPPPPRSPPEAARPPHR
jgi:hypothetical protein